ncbi:MAG: hypothetical protein WAK93_12735 [Solirubrobacteraceae bacterium]
MLVTQIKIGWPVDTDGARGAVWAPPTVFASTRPLLIKRRVLASFTASASVVGAPTADPQMPTL